MYNRAVQKTPTVSIGRYELAPLLLLLVMSYGCYPYAAFNEVSKRGGNILDYGVPFIYARSIVTFYGGEPTDEDFATLVPSLNALQTWYLDLRNSDLSDASVPTFRKLDSVEVIAIQGTHISVDGLRQLEGMHSLKEIILDSSTHSEGDVENLSRYFPHVRVNRWP